jgi:hypothetical protein
MDLFIKSFKKKSAPRTEDATARQDGAGTDKAYVVAPLVEARREAHQGQVAGQGAGWLQIRDHIITGATTTSPLFAVIIQAHAYRVTPFLPRCCHCSRCPPAG